MLRSHYLKMALSLLVAITVAGPTLTLGASGDADGEPKVVVVQHILIGFKRSVSGKKLARTKAEAKALAASLLERAIAGEDFDAMVKEYTNDRYPGMLLLTNSGEPQMSNGRRREDMVPRFGDVSFSLAVGEVGLAKFHAIASPYGWHVIKRLE